MSLVIRDAKPSDLPSMTDIYRHSVESGTATYELSSPDLTEMTRRYNENTFQGYPYLIAEDDDGQVLGYAYAGTLRARPAYRWSVEDSIYLDPNAQGKGVGSKLLNALVLKATELGFRQMIAVIGGASPQSISVHRKAGFEDAGVMKATGYKHGKWLDTTIMQLALGDGNQSHPDTSEYPGNLYQV